MWNINLISDTHNKHNQLNGFLEGGEVLIHAGDISGRGTQKEVESFFNWYDSDNLNYDFKLFIAGNHDFLFERELDKAKGILTGHKSIDYIQDELITLFKKDEDEEEEIKIWGSPWSPRFYDWAFNLDRNSDIMRSKWNMIPDDIDILITHTPPHGLLDSNTYYEKCGDELLMERIKEIKPKICVFGHIHEANGYHYDAENGIHFINASILDHRYIFRNRPLSFNWDSKTNEIEWT